MSRLRRVGVFGLWIGNGLLGLLGLMVLMLFGIIKMADNKSMPVVTKFPSIDGRFIAYTLSAIDGPYFAPKCYFSVLVIPANIDATYYSAADDFLYLGFGGRGGYEVFSQDCNPYSQPDKPPLVVWLAKDEVTILLPVAPRLRQRDRYRVKARDKSQQVKVNAYIFSSVKD